MKTDEAKLADAVEVVLALPLEKKIGIAQELWDSVASDPSNVPVEASQLEEIRRRKAAADADPTLLISEDELWRRVDTE